MSIISLSFLAFALLLLILYYAAPKRFQWWLLLIFSLGFYALSGASEAVHDSSLSLWTRLLSFLRDGLSVSVFLLITAFSTWGAALWIQHRADRDKAYLKAHKADLSKEERTAYKKKGAASRRRILTLCLLLNLGILCAMKYVHFVLAQANTVTSWFGGHVTDTVKWIVPLGISFYTFQTVAYLCDVYWTNCTAEKNPLKVLLFTSFFPQITQGPISTWKDLSPELFTPHKLDYHNFSYGAQRMIWGFFKKMVVANILSAYVATAFAKYPTYTGLATFMAALCYSAQIYADFSGYMDIMCGLCEMLGIRLTENFERPYFSKSVAEYWRRWHISLGAWFKNYVYYPLAVSRWNQKLGKWSKQHIGKAVGGYLPATIALVIVWLATGLWHGASWAYIAWGGVNGVFIIFSMWMEKPYEKWKKALHIRETSWLWRAFQVLRTFLLVTFIKVLPEVGTLGQGFGLWKRIFTEHTIPRSIPQLLPFAPYPRPLGAVCLGIVLMFVVSLLQRKGSVRARMERRVPYVLRLLVYAFLFFMIIYFGIPASGGAREGFLYAQF